MKITRIRLYDTGLSYGDGAYVWGAGNASAVPEASVVLIYTDAGWQGCGEFAPRGENDRVAHSEGVEETIAERDRHRGAELCCLKLSNPGGLSKARRVRDDLQNTTDLMNDHTRSTGICGPIAKDGLLYAPDTPGLGVNPDIPSLGGAMAEWRI